MHSITKPAGVSLAHSLLPIRTVSALTGVNPVTLRAWERRYGLINPQRTPKGHRLYSQQDVERIRQIVDLLSQGFSVGRVKPLLGQTHGNLAASTPIDISDTWVHYREVMLACIKRFDEAAMDNTYNEALSLYPVDIVNHQLTKPLLDQLGENWDKSPTGIAEEHFFSLYLRNKLGARIHHLNQRQSGPLLLLACMPDEQHETGLLFFAISAIDAGYRVLVLGANTPLQQLPAVLETRPCSGVMLSGTSKLARTLLEKDLPDMISQIDAAVFVGGKVTEHQHDEIEKAGAICLQENLAASLHLVSKTLNSSRPR